MNTLKNLTASMALLVIALTSTSHAANYTIDSGLLTNGYMNVFDLPSNGGGFVFGNGWGIPDLNVTFPSSTSLKFTPNTIGDPNAFWYTPSGGPGATGNKSMEANLYHQAADGLLSGQNVTFEITVTSFSLPLGHAFKVFVRDFAPDYSSVVENAVSITGTGNYSASLSTINDVTRHIQFGLQMKGPNVWHTDIGSAGAVEVSAVPEPSSATLMGLGVASLLAFRLRRKV